MAVAEFNVDDLRDFIRGIDGGAVTARHDDLKAFAFEGYDPLRFMRALNKIAHDKAITGDQFRDDLISMVGIAYQRGNLNKNSLKSMSGAGQTRVNELVARYNIALRENSSAKLAMNKDTVTFPRVLAAVPWVASLIIKSDEFFMPRSLMGPCESDNLPHIMKHTGFASMIPKGNAGKVLLKAHVAFMIDLGYVINPKNKDTLERRYQIQNNFSGAAFSSNILSKAQRINYMKEFGLNKLEEFKKCVTVSNKLMALLKRDDEKVEEAAVTVLTVNGDEINLGN
ncbi:nucleocapsid protein [Lettuce dieback associated virus]|nr:nucleocapsid protein [Lettuce dieback associated virus]